MIGLLVTTDNEMSKVEYDAPNYDIINDAVGGWYEHVHPKGLEYPYCMMVNEEGLMHRLPLNLLGSLLYGTQQHGQPIVGNIIILKEGYYAGEPDVIGMTEDEGQRLGDKLIKATNGTIRWTEN